MSSPLNLFRKNARETIGGGITHLLVGLGNPGDQYVTTRHNVGFLSLDYIAEKQNVAITRAKFKSLCAECRLGEARVLLLKPQTFMNNSGEAVREAASFYKIPPENIIVICDDINFDVGRMRIRQKGSDGGHNGLKSIIYQLSSDAFPRIRVGVGGKPSPEADLASHVLSNFGRAERETLFALFPNIEDAASLIAGGNIARAMNQYSK